MQFYYATTLLRPNGEKPEEATTIGVVASNIVDAIRVSEKVFEGEVIDIINVKRIGPVSGWVDVPMPTQKMKEDAPLGTADEVPETPQQ